jgi:hypothetical protein
MYLCIIWHNWHFMKLKCALGRWTRFQFCILTPSPICLCKRTFLDEYILFFLHASFCKCAVIHFYYLSHLISYASRDIYVIGERAKTKIMWMYVCARSKCCAVHFSIRSWEPKYTLWTKFHCIFCTLNICSESFASHCQR